MILSFCFNSDPLFSYALVHANRKSFSNVKVLVAEDWSPSASWNSSRVRSPPEIWTDNRFFDSSNDPALKTFLGVLDTAFMVVYALSLYAGGSLGDRIDLRILLCGSMACTCFFTVMFACVADWIGLYSIYWYVTFWILNGISQGPIWPCIVAIMGNWFGKSNRGLIFGLWSSNSSVGNIIGSLIVASFVDFGYDIAMLMPAVIMLNYVVVLYFGLVVSPGDVDLDDDNDENPESSDLGAVNKSEKIIRSTEDVKEELDAHADEKGLVHEVGLDKTIEELEVEKLTEQLNQRKQQPVKAVPAVGFMEAVCLPGVVIVIYFPLPIAFLLTPLYFSTP